MRFIITLVLSFALASVQVSPEEIYDSLTVKFRQQSRHMVKHTLPNCSDGPIEAVVPSTDLTVIKETYDLAEYVITPRYIKVKVCGAMGRDLNIYAGTCSSRSTCQPRDISIDEIYFQVQHVKNNVKHIIPVTINNQINCECK
ncbi:hypothetical protein B566_EDAN015673 [Ephemera danica]|nr:hypothetical protein B566_EDAN015673 [Ephemera danica]